MKCLTHVERRVGRIYFITFAALFALVATIYVCAHRRQWETRAPAKEAVTAGAKDGAAARPPLTGVTGISPSETSLPGTIGFAFIFGFAIRRTIGLLDTIKQRIFPDPS